jgi:hypothetical protein
VTLDHRRGAVSAGPSGEHILCAWDDCERRGLLLFEVRVNYSADPQGHPYTVRHLFCSIRHQRYWTNGHRAYGNLPAGCR